ncbi:MAG: AAA family ATPase [Patescibacteria group bacterium]|nr:AAA family ATPase [Patescibacteria group bacterium]MDE2116445.1 AAA family ATPase [Patescibacteria group bacterium]
MYLKSLELSGFKSFAKKSTLEFNDRVTAIVGPNGSGKSNVAEAFRFVLGEQSIKSMRGTRTEDLIFNGGESSPRANRASVKLVFDNAPHGGTGGRLLNIDFDEVAIERVIHRDSLSEYFINGSHVRLRDIVELLSGAHIGASGHHIISQGEADRILNANVRERREMVEDALGLKIYQYKREESERKLGRTRENMDKVESLRKEIAPHIKFLKKQVERVEKTIALREELRNIYKEYLARESRYLDQAEKTLALEGAAPKRDLERLDRELAQAKKVLEASHHRDARSAELISLEAKLKSAREARDEASRSVGRIEGEVGSLEKMLGREKASAAALAATVEYSKVKTLVDKVDELLGDMTAVPKIRELLRGFLASIKDSKSENRASEIEKELVLLQSRKKEADHEIKTRESELSTLSDKYTALQKEIEKEKDSSRDAEKAMFRIMAEENEVRGRLSVIRLREDKLKLEREDFKRELGEGAGLIGREITSYETAGEYPAEERRAQEERRREIEKIKVRLEDQGGVSPDDVMKEFKETSERDEFLARELVDLERSAESLTNLIKELEEKLDTLFSEGIAKINKQFKEFFALMFGGGEASLTVTREKKRKRGGAALSDEEMAQIGLAEGIEASEEPEEEETELGVGIHVNLPRKKIKALEMLSGGERALTSIALLFAISQVNPPPFIILDETDAALDEANSKKYGDMVENLSKHSQLIVITHNRETMSRAGVLYGVTMGREGFSKLLSIAFNEAVAVAK